MLTQGILRKVLIVFAGLMLIYVGLTVIGSVRAAGIGGSFNSVGEWIGVGVALYGAWLALSYGWSVFSGGRVRGIKAPFVNTHNDPTISKDDRIKALADLRDQKLLTPDQFEKKRAEIMRQKW